MNEKCNQKLMHIVKEIHGLIDTQNLSHQRESQDKLGSFFTASKQYTFSSISMNTIHGEWTRYNCKSNTSAESIILYCHGGGYMTGSSLYARGITTKLAKYAKLPVLTFNYRLAPEHPFPAALEDAITTWNYLLEHNYSATNIILAGDSAGGNLALSLTLYLKEHSHSLPKCLLLFSPWTDLSATGESYTTKCNLDPILTKDYLIKAKNAYMSSYTTTDPYISPLSANLEGFPPVYIQVGANEILLSDSIMLHDKLLCSNVISHLEIFPHMWHVFQLTPIRPAHNAIKSLMKSIKS